MLPKLTLHYSDTCESNWAVIQLAAEGGTPSYSFQWSNGNTGEFNPRINNSTYQIIVSDINQCRDTVTVTTTCVEQGSIIIIPQAFAPNGDGKNDFLPVFADGGIIASIELSIFNRWGQLSLFNQ